MKYFFPLMQTCEFAPEEMRQHYLCADCQTTTGVVELHYGLEKVRSMKSNLLRVAFLPPYSRAIFDLASDNEV